MRSILSITITVFYLLCVGCGDSKHVELAKDFTGALNLNDGYQVELVKASTKQANYIVLRNTNTGTLDAYNLEGYTAGDDINEFIAQNSDSFYYGVEFSHVEEDYYFVPDSHGFYNPIYGYDTVYGGYYEVSYTNVYVDRSSGILFSKQTMNTSDLSKAMELIDNKKIKSAVDMLTVQFRLSPARAHEVAAYGLELYKSSPEQMTTYAYDRYAEAILGLSYTDIQQAVNRYSAGDTRALDEVYLKAAEANGISVSRVKSLANLFIKN